MKRKLFGMLLSLVLVLACLVLLPNRAQAAEIVASGSGGKNVTWILDTEGKLTISGTGDMAGVVTNESYYIRIPWAAYTDSILTVVIEPGITTIGTGAFQNCKNLQSVTIPDSVTRIGSSAFWGCVNLKDVVIPASVTTMGSRAFAECNSFTNIIIPDSVTSMGYGAFSNCSGLQQVKLSNQLTSISSEFFGCTSLESIVIPEGVTSVGGFGMCTSLRNIVLPASVTTIGRSAFEDCTNLQSVTILGDVSDIGERAFYMCTSLQTITFPDRVTNATIGDYAFYTCQNLRNIVIPEGVTRIGELAFNSCTSLQSIVIPSGVEEIEGHTFQSCWNLQSVNIPEGVKKVGIAAFGQCQNLKGVGLPESVASIDEYAFANCDKITDVYYGGSNIKWGGIAIDIGNEDLLKATRHYQVPAADKLLQEMVDYNVPVETIRETVQSMDSQELAQAMKTDSEAVENLAKLEDKVGGSAEVVVENASVGIAAQGAQIVGANLNNVTGGQSAALVIATAEQNNRIPENFEAQSAVQFSMTLENVENTEELAVPVVITLPIPEELNPKRVSVIHYHSGGTEVLEASVEEVDGMHYASIVVEGFSDFAMVERKHVYSHQYDYKCDICGTERIVDMTRPMVDMFRMYNPNTGEHFYTGSEVERDNLIGHGWKYENIGFTFPKYTGKPVYRLFQPSTGEHLYTMDKAEKEKLEAEGWNYEGVAFNSGFENEVPQYRLHNPNATVGAYHFTASLEERAFLLSIGWEDQGIGWYSLGKM